jgi:hypothetical protein
MHAELLSPSSPRWPDLLATLRADAYYAPAYVRACARQEGGEGWLFAATEGENVWLQPLVVRPVPDALAHPRRLFDAVSPYGYSGPLARVAAGSDPTAWAARAAARLAACLAERRIVALLARLHPILNADPDPLRAHGNLTQRGVTVVVDLRQPSAALWQQTRRDHRRDINKLQRAGFTASISNEISDTETFRRIYFETMQRVGASPSYYFPKSYFDDLVSGMGKKIFLCSVQQDAEIACCGLFTEVDGIVEFHLSGTADQFVAFHPSKFMLHYVTHWAKDRGNTYFHLGGGAGASVDQLLEFKRGFSKSELPFYTWELTIDQAAYGELVDRWRGQAGPAATTDHGYFPLYRAPRGDRSGDTGNQDRGGTQVRQA